MTRYQVRAVDDAGFEDDPWEHASVYEARDPEEAAQKFAESYDQDGYYLSRSESHAIIAEVRLAVRLTTSDAQTHRFRCSAEHSVTYWAEEVELDEAAP